MSTNGILGCRFGNPAELRLGDRGWPRCLLAWRKLGPETEQAGTAVRQADLARRAHVVELFNRAAGQLGDEKLEVRLAAIYVLREVGRDFPDLAGPSFELLEGYLERRQFEYGDGEPPADVNAIVEALAVRRR